MMEVSNYSDEAHNFDFDKNFTKLIIGAPIGIKKLLK